MSTIYLGGESYQKHKDLIFFPDTDESRIKYCEDHGVNKFD